ncbi:MAG: hypothetical protein KDK70_42760, partial [Myxococcales bacterium]|nr:hypothetical protein [Myxococcales bacterium]
LVTPTMGMGQALAQTSAPAGTITRFGYRIAANDQAAPTLATADDLERVRGHAIHVEGSARRGADTYTFAWDFDGDTRYDPCEIAAELAAGGEAELSPASVVHGAALVVAARAEQRHEPGRRAPRTVVESAAAIEPEWLLELGDDALAEHTRVTFDPKTERVEAVSETRYEGLVIDATPLAEVPPEAAACLAEAARARGARAFVDDPAALDAWLARVRFLAEHHPGTSAPSEDDVTRVLTAMCEGKRSFAELRRAGLLDHLRAELRAEDSVALEQLAPARVTLPGGRALVVHYEPDRPPWVESRLQDFFGSTDGPRVARGQVPLVLHLLAPNHRAVQVTTDLAGFWERHYPSLRKALMRRYPRHDWPEDPRSATPPAPGGRRRR